MTFKTPDRFPTMLSVWDGDSYCGVIQERNEIKAMDGTTPHHWAVIVPAGVTEQFASKELAAAFLKRLNA